MTTTCESALVQDVVHAVPALQGELNEHLRDFDELLAHVFFGRVSAWFEKSLGHSQSDAERTALLDVLEKDFADGDESVQNLIAVSFVENLLSNSAARACFGPQLTQVYDDLRHSSVHEA